MTRAENDTTRREDVGRVPRRRGAVNGFLVVLLGLWGATVPLFGPYLGLGYGTDAAWQFTGDRLVLNFLPGLAVVLGGLGLIASVQRAGGVLWGWLAALGGAWFVVGPVISTTWNGGTSAAGEPVAASVGGRAFTELVYFGALGTLIVFLAAVALGRFTAGTGRTVVVNHGEVPEHERGLHDDAKHRVDDPNRADGYDQGARDDADRPFDGPGSRPGDAPGGRPLDAPGGRPMDRPSGRPLDAPGGRPVDAPGSGPVDGPGNRPLDRGTGEVRDPRQTGGSGFANR